MNIVDTGVRGYLKWLKADQPGIYKAVAAAIVQQAPRAFSDFEQSRAMGALMGSTSGAWHSGIDWSDRPASMYGWNNPAEIANPYGRVALGNLRGDTSGGWDAPYSFGRLGDDGTTTTFDQTDTFNPPASTDVSSVANTGQASADTTSIIGNIVSAFGQAYLAKQNADLLSQANQIQLQRAQVGLPPLDLSTLKLGVPQLQVGLNQQTLTGGGIALGVAALLGLAYLMKPSRSRARA
jgi:hypothetical protein